MSRSRKTTEGASPFAGPTARLLAHAETVEIAPDVAGMPPSRRRQPAHRRLAKARRIPPQVETEVELFALAWEMVEGGAHEPGAGGDGLRTREEVMTAAIWRIEHARRRVSTWQMAVVIASCVECLPAWQVALGAHILRPPVEQAPERWQREAREALDTALIPVLHALSGIPLDDGAA